MKLLFWKSGSPPAPSAPREDELSESLGELKNLPPLPDTAVRAMAIANDPAPTWETLPD